MKKYIIFLLFIVLASCTTLKIPNDKSVMEFIEILNSGDAETLSNLSQSPFLLDQEIIYRKSDIAKIWQAFVENDYQLFNAEIIENEFIYQESYSRFSSNRDVKVFFDKYLNEHTKLYHINSDKGEFLFLFSYKEKGIPTIYGLLGPIL